MLLRNADDGSEVILFSNPGVSLTINIGNNLIGPFFGSDSLTVLSVDPAFSGDFIVNGEFGAANVIFDGDVWFAGGDVTVTADALAVRADAKARAISLAISSSKATEFAVDGSINFNSTHNVTNAVVDDGASLVVGNGLLSIPKDLTLLFGRDGGTYFSEDDLLDGITVEDIPSFLDSDRNGTVDASDAYVTGVAGGAYQTSLSTLIHAEDQAEIYSFTGGFVVSNAVGVGASVSVNELNRDVAAIVGQALFKPQAITANGEIDLGYAHGFSTGDAIRYDNGGGESIGSLLHNTEYFAIVTGPTTIRLATSYHNAIDKTGRSTLDGSAAGGSSHSFRRSAETLGGGSFAAAGEMFVSALGEGTIGSGSIAGLAGGAELFGIVPGLTDEYFGLDFASDDLAAVIRLDMLPTPLVDANNFDDYEDYDVVLFVNLTNVALASPKLSVLRNGTTSSLYQGLAVDGLGTFQTLPRIGPGEVWATLVPENEAVAINASLFGDELPSKPTEALLSTLLSGRSLSVSANPTAVNNAIFIKSLQRASSIDPAEVPGFDDVAVSANGSQFFAVNAELGALIVANGDGSQRQLLKDGQGSVTTLGGASKVAFYESQQGPADSNLYVTATADQRLNVFSFVGSSGEITLDTSVSLPSGSQGSLLISGGSGSKLFSGGSTQITRYDRATDGSLSNPRSISARAEDLALSSDNSVLFAVDSVAGTLRAYTANAGTLTTTRATIAATQVSGLKGASDLAIDGEGFLYVTSPTGNTLSVFRYDAVEESFAFIQTLRNGHQGVLGMTNPSDIAISPDDQFILVTGRDSNAIAVFQKRQVTDPQTMVTSTNGQLIFVQVVRDNVGGNDGLGKPTTIKVAVRDAGSVNETHIALVGTLNSGGDASLASFAIARNLPAPIQFNTEFSTIEAIAVRTADGNDDLTLQIAPSAEVVRTTLDSATGDDIVTLTQASPITDVILGLGNDRADVRLVPSEATLTSGSTVTIHGDNVVESIDDGNDVIDIEKLTAATTVEIFGGRGGDVVSVDGKGVPLAADPETAVVIAHGENPANPTTTPDTFRFDPQNTLSIPNYILNSTVPGEGNVRVNGHGLVSFDTFEGDAIILAAPIITFVGTPYVTLEGGNVTLSANVVPQGSTSTLSGDIKWDLDGDGGFDDAVGSTIVLNWDRLVDFGLNDDGVYQVGVQATNSDDQTSREFTSLVINNLAPAPLLTGPNNATVGEEVTIGFTRNNDPGDDTITKWHVNWGDGSGVQEYGAGTNSANHVYNQPGPFAVAVTVFDEDTALSGTTSAPKTISVGVTSNQVHAGGIYTILEGQSLELAATVAGAPTLIRWDVNGDNDFTDVVGLSPVLTWQQLQALANQPINNDGDYSTRVEVTYAGLAQPVISAAALLRVINVAPSASFDTNQPVDEGSSGVVVTIINAADPSAADFGVAGENLRYSFDFDNDGVFELGFVGLSTPAVTVPARFLADDGLVRIRATVNDDDAATELFTDLQVLNVAPELMVVGADTTFEGSPYELSLSATDDGDDTVQSWRVNWGDGTNETYDGSSPTVTHRFADNGVSVVQRQHAIDRAKRGSEVPECRFCGNRSRGNRRGHADRFDRRRRFTRHARCLGHMG